MNAMNPSASTSARRQFLFQSAASLGSFAVANSFGGFLSRTASAANAKSGTTGYGKLRPVTDETTGLDLLQLPDGFRYSSFSWTKDTLDNGTPTPGKHDGMAVVAEHDGILTICRNHEMISNTPAFGPADMTYDPAGPGGCFTLKFDAQQGKWLSAAPSLSGTFKNCAGGPTPWGTWLSCEETVLGPGDKVDGKLVKLHETHGWIFEVHADAPTKPVPLKDMGRFVHEAVAVDPLTGNVYETEDRATAGFYRFRPNKPGELTAGGRLHMLKIKGVPDVRKGRKVGDTFDVTWVPIDDPGRPHFAAGRDEQGVFMQGKQQQATTFARLEGCWYGNGRVYLNSTSGGDKGLGQVWQYDPANEQLQLIFESPAANVLDSPDNITVSPRGGIVLCEDGDVVPQRLHGLTLDGRLFPLAANNMVLKGERNGFKGDLRGEEWAGATFSPDGKWLFANLQTPGLTVAITGPWGEGLL